MNRKLVLCLVALALLAGAVLYLVSGDRAEGARSAPDPSASAPRAPDTPLREAEAVPAAAVETVAREAAPAPVASRPSPSWRGQLAGLTGRVVESDGTPVADIRVSLVEMDPMLLFQPASVAPGETEPSLELEETRTDTEGRFVLGGALASTFHALGVDLQGPRATLRIVDQGLVHGQWTDVGDVVLAPFGILTGRVVDESGQPVPGARVRAAALPEEILVAAPYEFRADTLVAFQATFVGLKGYVVVDAPTWIRHALERLPFPTTESGADGAFRLEGVQLAKVVGGADKRGYVGVPIGPLDMTQGAADVGDLVLQRGRTLRGVVEDPFGEPVVGAVVFAGAEVVPGILAFLQPCGLSDDDGAFALTGVAPAGQLVAAARRNPDEAWAVATSSSPDGLLLELEALVHLTVNVRDEAGAPLTGARLALRPVSPPGKADDVMQFVSAIAPRTRTYEGFREIEPGRYRRDEIAVGSYEVEVRKPELAPGLLTFECRGPENEVTVVCPRGERVELEVIDRATREPVADARCFALHFGSTGFVQLDSRSTDRDGRAVLGPLSLATREEHRPGFPEETLLAVRHPGHGEFSGPLVGVPGTYVVELDSGGAVAGRVHWGGARPERIYMVSLNLQGRDGVEEILHLPRLTLTDLEGAFQVQGLAPGEYGLKLHERFLDQDPLGLMVAQVEPVTLHQEDLEVRSGETTEVSIDLTPSGRGATARIVGQVRLEGRACAGAEVKVRAAENVTVLTDERGRYETPAFAVRGHCEVLVSARLEGEMRQVHQSRPELSDGEVHTLDVDLYPRVVRARVLDAADGRPLEHVLVTVEAADGDRSTTSVETTTDAEGQGEIHTFYGSQVRLRAHVDGYADDVQFLDLGSGVDPEPLTIRLRRSVPCAGRVAVSNPGSGGFSFLLVNAVEGGARATTRLEAPEFAFDLEGLPPGSYTARVFVGGTEGESLSFELGPSGDRNLELPFTPQTR